MGFWWENYKSTEQRMFEALAGLAHDLGRLPTAAETSQRTTVCYTSDYPDHLALMTRLVARLDGDPKWWAQLIELKRKTAEQERQAAKHRNQKQDEEWAMRERIRQAKERERAKLRRAVIQEVTRAAVQAVLPTNVTGVTQIDVSEVSVEMARKPVLPDKRIYQLAWEALREEDFQSTATKMDGKFREKGEVSFVTVVRRIGPLNDWPRALLTAAETGKLVLTESERAELQKAAEGLAGSTGQAVEVRKESEPEAEVLELQVTGRANLAVTWGGKKHCVQVVFGGATPSAELSEES